MKVHLTGSSSDPSEDMPYLRCIVECIHKNKVSIVLNWIEAAYSVSNGKAKKTWNWSDIVKNNLDALEQADAIIVEGTNHGFFQGVQICRALDRRLPILFLTRNPVSSHPISGINNRLLERHQYKTSSDLKNFVTEFIESNKAKSNELKVSNNAMHYIRGESILSGMSEVEVVDKLLSGRFGKF